MLNRWLVLSTLVTTLAISQGAVFTTLARVMVQFGEHPTLASFRGSIFTDDDCDPINDPGGCRRS